MTSVVIPNSVTTIEDNAFNVCNLTSIVIPSSVTSIGKEAFAFSSHLKEIISLNPTPPTLGEYCFERVDKWLCELKVPADAVGAYRTAEGWNEFADITGLTTKELEALSIPTLNQNPELNNTNLYNLQGQPVGEGYKGIVIRGGKKYLQR